MKYIDYLPKHKYGWLPILYSLVLSLKPKVVLEYGTEYGGTAITMALALKELQESEGHVGKITSYDTFNFQSKGEIGSNPSYELAISNINSFSIPISNMIDIRQGDFFEFNESSNKEYDLLYFDIDNDGSKVLEMYLNNKENIEKGSVVVFEGGSNVRDNVRWMIEKNKVKINDVKEKVPFRLLTPDQKYSCSIIYNPQIYEIEV